VKTGVTFRGKNRLGTFYPPLHTLIDLEFLSTVPARYLRSGVAEIIKIALVRDGTLFNQVDRHLETLLADRFQTPPTGEEVVRSAVHGMLDELEPNLFEDELRRGVDFGHSFSPGLEVASEFSLLHGEAVAVDMALSTIISNRRGLIGGEVLAIVLGLLRRAGLPMTHPTLRPEVLSAALRSTTEHRDGRQRVPLLDGIGSVRFVDDVTEDELGAAVTALADRARGFGHDAVPASCGAPDDGGIAVLHVGADAGPWAG
jgi:3-dehydroquinate synthase